jgi:hypothetical protein
VQVAAHAQAQAQVAGGGLRASALERGHGGVEVAIGAGEHRLGHRQFDLLFRDRLALDAARAFDERATQRHVVGAERGQRHRLEVRRQRAAAAGVGGQRGDAAHVDQHLGGAAHVGVHDDAVDPQDARQARVLGVVEACEAGFDVLQRRVVVAQLQQLVREVAVKHRVIAVAACRRRVAQRLVHVGEGLLGLVARRVAAGNRVQQQAALLVAQHRHALVAQGEHEAQRLVVAAGAPQAARDAGLREDAAGAVAQALEHRLRGAQLGHRFARAREVDQVKAARQPRPAFGRCVAARPGLGQRLVGQRDRGGRVDVQQLPRALREAQGVTGARGGGLGHASILRAGCGKMPLTASCRSRTE